MDKYNQLDIGSTFGDWTIIGMTTVPGKKEYAYLCECSAGHTRHIAPAELRRCHTGPMRCRKCWGASSHALLYSIWHSMHARCEKRSCRAWKDYGGRGITVCDEWSGFHEFKQWALSSGWKHGLTLDRADNDAGYCPNNCRFVSRIVNNNNKRNHCWVTAFGETKTVAQWTRDARCVATRKGLQYRIGRGWNAELAITKPRKTPVTH